jgi:molecular chaperone GrpE
MNTEEKETQEINNEAAQESTETPIEKPSQTPEEKINELNDKYLRLYSEFDNFRKRTNKEKAEIYNSATSDVFKSFLPVLDDFDRAAKSVQEAQDIKSLKQGVELIRNKLISTLKQKGLEEMDAKGKEFNGDLHEAITEIPAPSEKMKGKIVDVIEKGYTLDGKIVRYAKVVVGK